MNNTLQLLDERLAELLGWEGLHTYMGDLLGYSKTNSILEVPRWTADNGACFELMVEHSLEIIQYVDGVSARNRYPSSEMYTDHPTKEEAVRVAIVKAVITKLEAAQ
jgi:hypothetical protein